jgi:hypothetical protein
MLHQFVADGHRPVLRAVKRVRLAAVSRPESNVVGQDQIAIQFVGGAFQEFLLLYLAVDFRIALVFDRDVRDRKIAVVRLFDFRVDGFFRVLSGLRGVGLDGRILIRRSRGQIAEIRVCGVARFSVREAPQENVFGLNKIQPLIVNDFRFWILDFGFWIFKKRSLVLGLGSLFSLAAARASI